MRVRAWCATAVAMVFSFAILAASPAPAEGGTPKIAVQRQKLQQTIQQRRQAEHKLREVKQRQRDVLGQVRSSEQKLSRAQRDLLTARARLSATERRIHTTQTQLDAINVKLDQHTDQLWQRLSAMYKRGPAGYVEVVLGATSFEDFVDRATLFRSMTEHDLDLKAEIENTQAQQAVLKADLEQTWRELADLKSQCLERTSEIRVETNRKKDVLASVSRDRKAQEAAYQEALNAQRAIERVLYRLQNPPGSAGSSSLKLSGGFIKPCGGRYTSRFGWRRHPVHGRRSFHDGLDIANSYGTTIRAAAAGTVVQAGWHSSVYGNSVMINHGSGYVTFYGHCSKVLVRSGQKVKQGEAVARMGSTGWSTGSHVHFSIYKNSVAVNPLSVR